jgi:hypothetical protein
MADSGEVPGDRLRERADQHRWKLWLLLEADRWHVVDAMLVVVFVTLVAVGTLALPVEGAIRSSDSIDTLFQALLAATITGVTLVLTLNQLVLAQELGAAGDQRERMDGAMDFRCEVADAIDAPVSPARPAQFLRALVTISGDHAERLADAVDASDDALAEEVTALTDSIVANADSVGAGLDDARFGTFSVVSSALNFNYSWKLFTARRLREEYAGRLDDEAVGALDDLVETLKLYGAAREHVKTLYFQWDLINLSRHILVASLPAILISIGMVAFFNAATYSLTLSGVGTLVPLVALTATVAMVPFAVLAAYVLRIATVAKHTLSIGPFILRETDDIREVDWGE